MLTDETYRCCPVAFIFRRLRVRAARTPARGYDDDRRADARARTLPECVHDGQLRSEDHCRASHPRRAGE